METKDHTEIKLQTNVKKELDPTLVRMSGTTAHGNIDFDVPFMTEIAPNLWQGGCQNGLIMPHFIKHLVSLYPWQAYTVKHELRSALEVVMFDSLDQSTEEIEALASWVNVCRNSGPVLVHCQAGLNRSSLVVGTALKQEGMKGWEVVKMLREKRSSACLCNSAFERYIRND